MTFPTSLRPSCGPAWSRRRLNWAWRQFVGPVGADAEAQIAELESLVEAGVDGLAISSVSTDALAPVINRFLSRASRW
jgi:ABC-type sugar transport system substrate-binding protein